MSKDVGTADLYQRRWRRRKVWAWRGLLITDMTYEQLTRAFEELAEIHEATVKREQDLEANLKIAELGLKMKRWDKDAHQ